VGIAIGVGVGVGEALGVGAGVAATLKHIGRQSPVGCVSVGVHDSRMHAPASAKFPNSVSYIAVSVEGPERKRPPGLNRRPLELP
jgi:hypothetical protein